MSLESDLMSEVEHEILIRQIHIASARLHTVAELSNWFALFLGYAAIDLNIHPGGTTTALLTLFLILTALLLVYTVLLKLFIMFLSPRIDTAIFLARFDNHELDALNPERIIKQMEVLWIASTLVIFILFGVNFIVIIYVQFATYSTTAVTSSAVIMTPVLILSIIFAAGAYFSTRKTRLYGRLNREHLISRDNSKIQRHFFVKHVPQQSQRNTHAVSSKWDVVRAHVRSSGQKTL